MNKLKEFILMTIACLAFLLITGIAKAKPLVDFLAMKGLIFDHLEFSDHYNFRTSDIEALSSKSLIITTEKDYAKLAKIFPKRDIYYLPISVNIDSNKLFDKIILDYCNIS